MVSATIQRMREHGEEERRADPDVAVTAAGSNVTAAATPKLGFLPASEWVMCCPQLET